MLQKQIPPKPVVVDLTADDTDKIANAQPEQSIIQEAHQEAILRAANSEHGRMYEEEPMPSTSSSKLDHASGWNSKYSLSLSLYWIDTTCAYFQACY